MTRVAGIPEQLKAAAALLVASGPELELAAQSLASAPLPEMPPGVGSAVAASLATSSRKLHRAQGIAHAEGADLRRRGLWLEFADAVAAVYSVAVPAKAAGEIPLQVLDLVSRRRAFQMLETWGNFERTTFPIVRDYGKTSLGATNIWLAFQEHHPMPYGRFRAVVDGAGDLDGYARSSGVPLQLLRDVSGKVLGPVGVVGSAFQIAHPEHGVGDRVAGGAGFAGSLIGTSISYYGLEATAAVIPGADVIVAVLLIGAAGWDLWTHRKEVAKAGVSTGKFLLDHKALVLAGPEGAAAQVVWDHRHEAVRVTVASGEFVTHRAEDAAGLAVSVGKSGLHDVESGGAAVLHAGGSAVDEGKKLLGL